MIGSKRLTSKKLVKAMKLYELKADHHYIIEVKYWSGLSWNDLQGLRKYFRSNNIDVQFVPTNGEDFAFQAVPTIPSKEQSDEVEA